ncbi:MAG TPA: ThiF family adenylyltransferase, partial [Bacillota bacterium]|nr:ThiF family adenylyltransferase [Bacillota bacterium]
MTTFENQLKNDHDRILRYSRQIILKEFGYPGQEKLSKAKVLVVGAGGLGSPVLLYLAGAGVGTIGIADFDTVGISNLNRQIMHDTPGIGRRKVDSAADVIKRLNPEVTVIKHNRRLDLDTITDI